VIYSRPPPDILHRSNSGRRSTSRRGRHWCSGAKALRLTGRYFLTRSGLVGRGRAASRFQALAPRLWGRPSGRGKREGRHPRRTYSLARRTGRFVAVSGHCAPTDLVRRTSKSFAEPSADGRDRDGHDRRIEDLACAAPGGLAVSTGPGRNARGPAGDLHPHAWRRGDHQALGRQPRRLSSARKPVAPRGEAAPAATAVLALWLGNDLANPLAKIPGKGRELLTVAHGTKAIHEPIAAPVHPGRFQQPDERLYCFSGDLSLRCPLRVGHETLRLLLSWDEATWIAAVRPRRQTLPITTRPPGNRAPRLQVWSVVPSYRPRPGRGQREAPIVRAGRRSTRVSPLPGKCSARMRRSR